jgi:hypothetical protein
MSPFSTLTAMASSTSTSLRAMSCRFQRDRTPGTGFTRTLAGEGFARDGALRPLVRIRPLTIYERLLRSQVASNLGKIDEAMTVLADPRGPTEGPDAALIASGRGQLEMDRYCFRVAEAELKRALTMDPSRVEARRRLIMLYAQQGRSAEIAALAPALVSMQTPDFLDPLLYVRLAPVD